MGDGSLSTSIKLSRSDGIELGDKITGPESVTCELAGLVTPPAPSMLLLVVAVDRLQLNCGWALLSVLMLLTDWPLRRLPHDARGEEDVYKTLRSCRSLVGGGSSMLNGNSWPLDVVAESGIG